MKFSLTVACAVMLSLGTVTPGERRRVGEDGEDVEDVVGEDEVPCLADPAASAELSVVSGQNATGHWLAKVRLLHAAGEAGDGASLPPVHLQLQRSAQRRRGGARTVALEATLAGSPTTRLDGSPANSALLESSYTRCSEPIGCPPPQPCPTCPTPQPCPSPCPAACPACPSPAPYPEPPECPSPCPALCPTCPPPPACPEPPKCPSPCPALTPVPRQIPPGYVLKEGFGYYKYHTVTVNWFQAKATCEREGAYLVIINSKDEAQMVLGFFKALRLPEIVYHTGIRVGLHDLFKEGVFLTVLGQHIADTGYAEWSPNEPNNALGGENCVTLSIKGHFNDIRCDWNGTFVCELPN